MLNEEKLKQRISRNIKHLMASTDKTSKDIADGLGVSKSTVSRWVNGQRIPRMDYIDKLCAFFKCSRNDILSKEELTLDITKLNKTNQDKLLEYFELLLNSQN